MLNHYRLVMWVGLLGACLSLFGCAGVIPASPLDVASLKNLSYAGIYHEPVTLQQGRYEGKPYVPEGAARPRVRLVEQLYVIADLDNDGVEEAAVFLTESAGGSGSYTFLAIIDEVNGQYQNVATQKLGDRIQVRNLEFKAGLLSLNLVTAAPDEAACCPTLKVQQSYHYHAGQLVQTTAEPQGQVSLADLQGRWKLTHFDRNEPVPAETEVTLEFRDAQFAGLAGCNRYFGAIKGKAPLNIAIGPIGATRRMCPTAVMQVEDRFLPALQQATQFRFLFGQLALSYQDDKGLHSLLFAPQ